MSTVALTIDVFCQKNWDSSPVYRVYVDNDLLTERTWVWPAYEIYIKENIEVDVEPGQHRVVVYTCVPNLGNVIFKNLTVNGVVVPDSTCGDFQEYTFNVLQ